MTDDRFKSNLTATHPAEAAIVAELAGRAALPHAVDPAKVTVMQTPDGPKVLDLDKYLDSPRRKSGTYQPATVDALIDYVTNHLTVATTLWIDATSNRITAVINDHSTDIPGWGAHRAVLKLQPSPEWIHWTSKDGAFTDQEAFAEHIQDGIEEIRNPDSATMLEIVQTIQGATKADWKTATRLDNGEVSFAYHEQIEATAGRAGHLEIPQTFDLAIAPFYGEFPFPVLARLRYRIRQGVLTIGYKLVRPQDVVLAVLGGIEQRLTTVAGFGHVYLGAPPA